LVFGPEVDRSGAWELGVLFAEKVGAPVYGSPLPDRVSFPEDHRLYQGPLPMTIAGATEILQGHDLVVVIGAQVFRYYPYVAGEYLPEGGCGGPHPLVGNAALAHVQAMVPGGRPAPRTASGSGRPGGQIVSVGGFPSVHRVNGFRLHEPAVYLERQT
jgi:Thiamine pyrophosphate enzyme, central domain